MPKSFLALRLARLLCVCLLCGSVVVVGNILLPAPGTEQLQVIPHIPARLHIPRLNIDAPVIMVGLDEKRQMEVPARAEDVGWFASGIYPGNIGSAVLVGHLDTVLGTPGVFWNLDELQTGDSVFVETSSGHVLRFDVTGSQSYPYDEAPLQEIFGSASGRLLNLITCKGAWSGNTYDQRLVVSSVLVEENSLPARR